MHKYIINSNAFSTLTPESAYWVGFLMADGCISNKGRSIKLQLAEVDSAFALEVLQTIYTNPCEALTRKRLTAENILQTYKPRVW